MPHLFFASPRSLPKAQKLVGRVVVLDIAFAATAGGGVSFEEITLPFLKNLGGRLAAWVDHHDHDRHPEYKQDPRFLLATKAEHGACPEMINPQIVHDAGPIDSIVTHIDLDGLYAAAKWILGGKEPYPKADDDARAVDTRIGTPSTIGIQVDCALRARSRDFHLRQVIVNWLVQGMPKGPLYETIMEAAAEFQLRLEGSKKLAKHYVKQGRVAIVHCNTRQFDKTELLLLGQNIAEVAIVQDSGMTTIAAPFDSGWNFVKLMGLEGGMPTRVTVPTSRLDEAISLINQSEANS